MPGGTDGMFYSFNMGPVHFISINTESYYFTEYGTDQVFSQYNWLLDDLQVCPVVVVRNRPGFLIVSTTMAVRRSSSMTFRC